MCIGCKMINIIVEKAFIQIYDEGDDLYYAFLAETPYLKYGGKSPNEAIGNLVTSNRLVVLWDTLNNYNRWKDRNG